MFALPWFSCFVFPEGGCWGEQSKLTSTAHIGLKRVPWTTKRLGYVVLPVVCFRLSISCYNSPGNTNMVTKSRFLGLLFRIVYVKFVLVDVLSMSDVQYSSLFWSLVYVWSLIAQVLHVGVTLPKFNSSPLKTSQNPIGKDRLPTIFQGQAVKLQGVIVILHSIQISRRMAPPQ